MNRIWKMIGNGRYKFIAMLIRFIIQLHCFLLKGMIFFYLFSLTIFFLWVLSSVNNSLTFCDSLEFRILSKTEILERFFKQFYAVLIVFGQDF